MKIVYNTFVLLYAFVIKLVSVFSVKAKQWIDGRADIISKLKKENLSGKEIIWVHCASLGEFEQARPIIENLRTNYPNYSIFLTFFSPSGYEVRKNYELADFVYYLPIDTPQNAKQFIEIVNPRLVVIVKYEFWFNYIDELYKRKIPLFFISVIFRPSQYFFKPWGQYFAQQLNKITYLFVQNKESLNLLDNINIHHAEISGDTRFDRVAQLPNEQVSIPIVNEFKGNSKLLVAGSSWQPDEKILLELLDNSKTNFKLVIAPHMINKEHINEITKRFSSYNPVLYTNSDSLNDTNSKVLIINTIGMLSHIYNYAYIAYIGGGFGVGIHNLLEASTYGIPVIFGPNHTRFREAIDLTNNGGGFPISNSVDCLQIFDELMLDETIYNNSAITARNYVQNNAGATFKIINKIKDYCG